MSTPPATARIIDDPLPATLNTLADAGGVEAAMQICLARGGSRIRIPQRAEGSDLAKIVGIDAARQIVKSLADERLEIPTARKPLYRWLRGQGYSQEKAGGVVKICRRTAQAWDKADTPTRQISFFGNN